MGWKKKDSDHRLRLRLERDREERETLIPCLACEGAGSVVITSVTQYRHRICRWCNGSSAVSHEVAAMYRRIQRLYGLHRTRGLCQTHRKFRK